MPAGTSAGGLSLRYHARMPTSSDTPVLLASRSPRRRRLLACLGFEFEISHVDTPEDLDSPLASDPEALARALAAEKAEAAKRERPEALVLCFDTIVVHEGKVLGKPSSPEDGRRMLESLSGRTHEVVTGCAVWCPESGGLHTFAVTTPVTMKRLDEAAIAEWMSSGEYLGCAGAYNIEGQVAHVTDDECYQNVAGLPLCHLYAVLSDAQLTPCAPKTLRAPVEACDALLCRTCRLGPRAIQPR